MSVLMRAVAAKLRNRAFSVAEAAAMTGMTVVQVNNAIQEIAPFGQAQVEGGRRAVEYGGIFCLLLVQDMTGWANPALRREILAGALRHPKKKAIPAASQNVVVPVDGLRKKAQQALRALYESEEMITSNKNVLSGEPCIAGTRIPAHAIAAIAEQHGAENAIDAYPQLSVKQVTLATLYSRANPRRGRPRKESATAGRAIGRVKAESKGGRVEREKNST
jgi:uncharacterized protein (DUF433 family)